MAFELKFAAYATLSTRHTKILFHVLKKPSSANNVHSLMSKISEFRVENTHKIFDFNALLSRLLSILV